MARINERIPKEIFEKVFRPMVRALGTRNVIIRLNEEARTAIPRQTKLGQLMPKLQLLCYEQNRPKVDDELDRLWNVYFDMQIEDEEDRFLELTDQLNENLDGENLPEDGEKLAQIKETIGAIHELLAGLELDPETIEAAFRIKAYPEVLDLYLDEYKQD